MRCCIVGCPNYGADASKDITYHLFPHPEKGELCAFRIGMQFNWTEEFVYQLTQLSNPQPQLNSSAIHTPDFCVIYRYWAIWKMDWSMQQPQNTIQEGDGHLPPVEDMSAALWQGIEEWRLSTAVEYSDTNSASGSWFRRRCIQWERWTAFGSGRDRTNRIWIVLFGGGLRSAAIWGEVADNAGYE